MIQKNQLISRADKHRVFDNLVSLMRSVILDDSSLEANEKEVAKAFVDGTISKFADVPPERADDVISIIHAYWDIESEDTDVAIDLLSARGLVDTKPD